jgi:phosphoribosylglycinamide formyltransferase 1
MKMERVAIFASGKGTNAEKIIEACRDNVALIVSGSSTAGVIDVARKNHIPFLVLNKDDFYGSGKFLDDLKKYRISFIVLAGFLWKIPVYLLKHFENKIVNIHPALLPKFGGKGMFGINVHRAVLAAGEKESGITIHYVNENYDEGEIIFQEKCTIDPEDTPETLSLKVQKLEHEHYPQIIKKLVR